MAFNGIPWYSMVFNGIRWYLMVIDGIRWYPMVFNGILCYLMVFIGISLGIHWDLLVFDGTRPRAGLRPAGPRWIVGRAQFSWAHFSRLASRLPRSARRGQL